MILFVVFQYWPLPQKNEEIKPHSQANLENLKPNTFHSENGNAQSLAPNNQFQEKGSDKVLKKQANAGVGINADEKENPRTNHTIVENRKKIDSIEVPTGYKVDSAIADVRSQRHTYKRNEGYLRQNTISERELMRHLFELEDNTLVHTSTILEGVGDIYKIKEPIHWDLTVGPAIHWMYPVDGFSTSREPYSEKLLSWRFPGLNIALVLNQKWSLGMGVMGGKTSNFIRIGEGYPTENLLHFPEWSEVRFPVDHIKIESRQILLALSLKYQQKIIGDFGFNFKVGMVAH